MADVHDKKTRSKNMAAVKSKNTALEIIVRKFLHSQGFRFRVHKKTLPGKPDIVLPKYKTVIFVHGCFWHGHEGCKKSKLPKTDTETWRKKIEGNKENDIKVYDALVNQGWKVAEVWGCTLSSTKKEQAFNNLKAFLLTS